MVIVACLTHTSIPISTIHMLFTDKKIETYLVFPWLKRISAEKRQKVFKQINDDLAKNDGKIFGTNFTKDLSLEKWQEALDTFESIQAKDGGKILIHL